MNHSINDSFMNLNRFGYAIIPFKLSDKEPRSDVPKWRIARSNARSMGKASFTHTKACRCGSFEKRVYDLKCIPCFKREEMKIKLLVVGLFCASLLGGCARDADVASRNLAAEADNFQLDRRIVFYNGITGEYILTIEGKCAFDVSSERKVDVTCKTGDGLYKKHSLGISDNVTYFSEQLSSKGVSVYHYKVDFKPQLIIPDIDLKVSLNK